MINFNLQNHKPLREIVYEELKRQIMVGEILPGTRMMEVELADEMGVSRTPVREAIRKMEKEGLVTIEPRRGAYVSDISVQEMVDVLEVRQDLEGMAAAIAARKIRDQQKTALLELSERYRKAIDSGNIAEIIDLDEEFHKNIVGISENKTLIQMVSKLQELALRFRYMYYEDFSRFRNQPAEHQLITEAIISGDSEGARRLAEEHLSHLKEFVEREAEHLTKQKR